MTDSNAASWCLQRWHRVVGGGEPELLGELIADDAVLHSPVLFRPLAGKETVIRYLTAASMSFVGDRPASGRVRVDGAPGEWDGRFRYVREVVGEFDAVLEFETTMSGKYVNGVDMIRWDGTGRIVDFKVMVRPAQAIDAVRQLMVAALDTLGPTGG